MFMAFNFAYFFFASNNNFCYDTQNHILAQRKKYEKLKADTFIWFKIRKLNSDGNFKSKLNSMSWPV